MTLDPGSPPEYLIGHLEDALARDPRVTEQGLRVSVVGSPPTIVVSGVVADLPCKEAVAKVVRELLPGVVVRDEMTVAESPEQGDAEHVP